MVVRPKILLKTKLSQLPVRQLSSRRSESQESCGDKLELTTELPPSTNKLYQRRRGGQISLTEEAQRFKEHVKDVVVHRIGKVMSFSIDPELIYRFDITLYFDSLENPGWFEYWDRDVYYTKDSKDGRHYKGELHYRQGERKAATRYKRIDYDNRIKFLQDCVSKSIGIPDDSQIFVGHQAKREDPDNQRAEVVVTVETDTSQFFPKRSTNGSNP
jgi:Holliday junction resolvase RusA-like endonuclease